MKRLIELKIVKLEYSEKFTVYSLNDRHAVLKILNRCHTTTWSAMINNMADVFSAFNQR